jgi:hypothetical protein
LVLKEDVFGWNEVWDMGWENDGDYESLGFWEGL